MAYNVSIIINHVAGLCCFHCIESPIACGWQNYSHLMQSLDIVGSSLVSSTAWWTHCMAQLSRSYLYTHSLMKKTVMSIICTVSVFTHIISTETKMLMSRWNFLQWLSFYWTTSGAASDKKHDDVIKWKHFPRNWPFVRGIHRSPVNSPHKGQWRGALMFSLICVWIIDWVNNREAGDLRCYRAHYDVIVMLIKMVIYVFLFRASFTTRKYLK